MASLQILSPVAPSRTDVRPLAGRLDGLDGARVALLDNQKANAGELLAAVGEHLAERYPTIELSVERKIATSASPADVVEAVVAIPAVVLAIAD